MSGVEKVLRRPVRDALEAVGFVPAASKLYRPSPGIVPRVALVDRVLDRRADVIAVTAAAGYGKSTFVAELAAADPRPAAWVSLSSAENDPAVLLSYIAVALDEIEPVDPERVVALWRRSPVIGSPTLRQFGAMLSKRRTPFVLVLDDAHELTSRDVFDVLPVLVAEMPPGSTVVLCARTVIPLSLGRLRVRRRVVEVGEHELAFDLSEAAAFFKLLDVQVHAEQLGELVERTEGWPVALYLAALARGTGIGPLPDVPDDFAGDHRFLVDFLGEDLLATVPADVMTFLREASCFERLSGALCDDVLDRHGSAELLESARRQNLLVVPLDDRREWYRFHHLMSEYLQTELARRDPARRTEIQLRASAWCDTHGDPEGAVEYAVRAGDIDRAESMVLRWFGAAASTGRVYPTVARWVSILSRFMRDRPTLMILAAWAALAGGDPAAASSWLATAAASLPELHPEDVHGFVGPVALAALRSVVEPMTTDAMEFEAGYAHDHVGRDDGHPVSCLALGAAAFMTGEPSDARRWFREASDTVLDRPLVVAICLAHVAVMDIEEGDWDSATTVARRAKAMLGDVTAVPLAVLVIAVSALVETRAGNIEVADADRALCRQHLTRLVGITPWATMQSCVALARAALLQGNRVEAAALVGEAEATLATVPGAVHVSEQLSALRREMASHHRAQQPYGPSSLTTAELRVLQLLPTHLSIAEIADRLYVSRNTVKSQTIAIYRKLGTSSRSGAVQIAAAAGLFHDVARPPA